MFEKFLDFVGIKYETKAETVEDFLDTYGGRTFKNGLYRILKNEDVEKWNRIIGDAFPRVNGCIQAFGYDWLGRLFAYNTDTSIVKLFEPGTGEVLDIGVDIVDFHDDEIVEYSNDCLASDFFDEWFEKNNKYVLKYNECAGYKVPLFLNGNDNYENLEVSDMEVYWGIMTPLMSL